jgi:hypothetical protein
LFSSSFRDIFLLEDIPTGGKPRASLEDTGAAEFTGYFLQMMR